MAVTGYFVNETSATIGLTDTKATLDNDASQGANAAVVFTAIPPGVRGNSIKIAYTVPPDNNVAVPFSLTVVQNGTFDVITAQLAVSSDGSTITTIANTVRAAIAADERASKLVTAANKVTNDGTGLCSAVAAAALTGGAKDDILPGEIRKVTAMADADAILLINAGATFIPTAGVDKRRAIARLLKYGAVSENMQS